MRFLAQKAFLHQFLAEAPGAAGRGMELDADEKAAAADLLDVAASDLAELGHEELAPLGGVLDELLLPDDSQALPGHRAGQGVAAEGRAVLARLEDAEDLPVGHDRRDRVAAAAQGLADDDHVGPHALVLAGEELARAAEAGLDLVGDEEDVVLLADLGGLPEEPVGRDEDAGLGLDGLDQEGGRVRRDGLFQGLGVAEGNDGEAGGEGAEVLAVEGFASRS